jgi:type IV secretion system protein VirB10
MRFLVLSLFACALLYGQTSQPDTPDLKARPSEPPAPGVYRVDQGTHILLTMRNSVSTKSAHVGDRLYAKTSFPVMVNQRIVIPEGSYVAGTITEVKRAGRMLHGKAEIQVRFDSLILPNGTTRDFKSDLGSVDGRSNESLDREHSKVQGPGNKAKAARTIAETTAAGAGIGTLAGAGTGHTVKGLGIGSGAGAAVGLATVLASRGPDADLTEGSSVEMVTDRSLDFKESELASEPHAPRTFELQRQPADPASAPSENHGGFKPAQ